MPGSRGELAAVARPKDDLLAVEVVANRLHRGQRRIGERDPNDHTTGKQAETLRAPQLVQLARTSRGGDVRHDAPHRL